MGLEASVGRVQHFAERTFHSLTALAGSYAARLRSGYKEHGSRIALGGLFFPSVISPISTAATPFNGVPQSLSSRDAIVLPLKSTISTDSKIRVNGNLITGLTAKINNGQEIPPPAPGEVNQPFDLPPNTTRLIPPLLVSADGTQLQPKVNEQEAPVAEDAGVEPPAPPTEPEPEKGNNQEVPPPPEGVSANPPSVLDLGPNESQVLSLATDAEGNPIPSTPTGGETVANPELPQRSYEGKLHILKATNSVTNAIGELDAKRSVSVTSQEALDKVEALFAKKGEYAQSGLTGYSIDFNSFDYELAKRNPEVQTGGMRVCPNNDDPRCSIDFIHTVRSKPKPGEKKPSAIFDILDSNAPLTQLDIEYLNRTLNGLMADYGAEAIYGTRTALIADPKMKEEAEQLIKDVKAVAAFKFSFTPSTPTP